MQDTYDIFVSRHRLSLTKYLYLITGIYHCLKEKILESRDVYPHQLKGVCSDDK